LLIAQAYGLATIAEGPHIEQAVDQVIEELLTMYPIAQTDQNRTHYRIAGMESARR
jgi:hypothetical protein